MKFSKSYQPRKRRARKSNGHSAYYNEQQRGTMLAATVRQPEPNRAAMIDAYRLAHDS